MTLSDTQWEFLKHVAELIIYAEAMGFKLTGGDLKRSHLQQQQYVQTGASKTLDSDHLRGLAIDFNIFFDEDGDGKKGYLEGDATPLGTYWKGLHPDNYWGGDWGWDKPHFGRKQ
jgi:hypothetical protein